MTIAGRRPSAPSRPARAADIGTQRNRKSLKRSLSKPGLTPRPNGPQLTGTIKQRNPGPQGQTRGGLNAGCCARFDRRCDALPQPLLQLGLLLPQQLQGVLGGGTAVQLAEQRTLHPLQSSQGSQHLSAAIGQVVVGVKDAARQLEQFAVVAKQQQPLHPLLGCRSQERPKPIAAFEQQFSW